MGVYDLEEAFKIIEDDLTNQIINGIKKTTTESVLKDDNITVWRTNQLKELQEFKKRNKKYFTKDRKKSLYKAINDALEDTYKTAGSSQQKKILDAVKDGLKVHRTKSDEEIISSFNGVNDRKLNSLIEETQKNLYSAELSAVRYAEDQYRQIIFNSNVYFNTGSGNLIKCIDMATRNFLESGINNIEYKNGRRVNIQSYAEMALRTAEKRSYIQGEAKMRDEYGLGLVIVNRRGNACPRCMQYVGKVFNDDVYGSAPIDPRFPLLSTAIAGGLYHPNCKDVHTTYFEGITTEYPAPTKTEIENAEKQYLLEQQQRFNERQIRKYKRLADGTLDKEQQETYNNIVRKYQAKQRKLIEENPTLRRKYWRESVLGKTKPDTKSFEIPELPEEPKTTRTRKPKTTAPALEEKPVEKKDFKFDALKDTMSEEDFAEFKKMIDENEYTYSIFNDYNKNLKGIIFNNKVRSFFSPQKKTLTYSFVNEEYVKRGMNKYGTLSHEYGHFIDDRSFEYFKDKGLTFKEYETLEKYTKDEYYPREIFRIKIGDKKVTLSDQYLEAMDKDIEALTPKVLEDKKVFKEADKFQKSLYESLGLEYTPDSFKNEFIKNLYDDDSTHAFQDFLDGAFSNEKTGLRWGHGEAYYNEIFNTFNKFKSSEKLKEAYKELGYNVKNKSDVKKISRRYTTASELWAHQIAALTVGGKELEVMEKNMPNTLNFIKNLLK